MSLLTNGTARTINNVFSMCYGAIDINCESKFKFQCEKITVKL